MTYPRLPILWLLVLMGVVQSGVLYRTVAPGLDAARFAKTAERIETSGPLAALRSQTEQPLFPLWLALVHTAIVRAVGQFPAAWAVSVHLAAAIPLFLTLLPLYAFSARICGWRAALIGGCYFCLLPEASRLSADGISDSTHLFFFTAALWAAARSMTGPDGCGSLAIWAVGGFPSGLSEPAEKQRPKATAGDGHWAWLLLSGAATGLALLTRAEIVALLLAVGLSLLGHQAFSSVRAPWRRFLLGAGAYVAGIVVVVVPYLTATDATTPHTGLRRALGRPDALIAADKAHGENAVSKWRLADGKPMSFALKDPGSTRQRGFWPALLACGGALARAYWYWIGLLAVYALWTARRSRGEPVDTLVRTVFGVYLGAVLLFCWREGYVSPRHFVPLVVIGIGVAGVGTLLLGMRLAAWRRQDLPLAYAAAVALAACLGCLWQTFRPVNHVMAAHRAAGHWLAGNGLDAGSVVDTHGLTGLYSGRITHPYGAGPAAWKDPQLAYVVAQETELTTNTPRARTLLALLARTGAPVQRFPGPPTAPARSVAVYRWRADNAPHRSE